MLSLDHDSFQTCPPSIAGLADDEHLALGLVTHFINLDPGELSLDRLP
jgi:hypothetical protein